MIHYISHMQTFIQTYLKNDQGLDFYKIFGYCSRGIPGIDILGMGSHGKLIKEKIIYVSKVYGVKIPPKRFSICLERLDNRKLGVLDLYWFELPSLILFWTLAEMINFHNIDQCLCSGKIGAEGTFRTMILNQSDFLTLDSNLSIISSKKDRFEFDKVLFLEDLIEGVFGEVS